LAKNDPPPARWVRPDGAWCGGVWARWAEASLLLSAAVAMWELELELGAVVVGRRWAGYLAGRGVEERIYTAAGDVTGISSWPRRMFEVPLVSFHMAAVWRTALGQELLGGRVLASPTRAPDDELHQLLGDHFSVNKP
jgi:hypothetical protein